jgi:hypothetical protein
MNLEKPIKPIHRIVDVCLGFVLLVGVVAFIYILQFFGEELRSWANYLLTFLGIFTTGTALTFFFSHEVRLRFSLVLFFSYITLIAVNGFLTINFNKLKIVKAAEKTGIDYDTRSQIEAYIEFKKLEPLIFPVIFPFYVYPEYPEGLPTHSPLEPFEKIFPLGGISKHKSLFCNETGEYLFYKSDRYGFNNDDTAYDQRVSTLLVGDSYTQGMCVPTGKDVAGSLREIGRNAITIGMGGNGPLLELASLKEYGPYLKPDSVVWMITEENDYLDLLVEKKNPVLLRYLQTNFHQGLVEKQDIIDRTLKAYIKKTGFLFSNNWTYRAGFSENFLLKLKKYLGLFTLRNRVGLTRYKHDTKRSKARELNSLDDERIKLLREIFKSAVKTTKQWGGELHIIYLPGYKNIIKRDFSTNQKVLSLIQELNIPVIKISQIFSKAKDPLNYFHYRMPSHYTAEAYRGIAKRINQYLDYKASPK